MAHGLNAMLKRGPSGGTLGCKSDGKTGIGSRRIFAPQFKLQVLDSYRNDADCKGNQRATARKYGIHRRQIQKWLQVEGNLRNSVLKGVASSNNNNISGNTNNNTMKMNSSSSSSSVVTTSSNTSVSMSELIVCPEAASSRKCGLEVALRSGAQSGRQQDDSSVVPQQHSGAACATETDTYHEQQSIVGGVPAVLVVQQQQPPMIGSGEREDRGGSHVLVDKRVPDIPHNNNNMYHQQQQQQHLAYEWHHYQMRRSPDTASSTSGSCYSDLGDISPLHHHHQHLLQQPLVACSDGQCDCTSESSLPLDYTIHTRTQTASSPHGATQPVPPAAHSPLLASMSSPVAPAIDSTSPPASLLLAAVPMDLSVRRPHLHAATIHTTGTPVPVIATVPPAPSTTSSPPPGSPPSATHIWDLSTAGRGGVKRRYDQENDSTCTSATATSPHSLQQQHAHSRPVKLFKPYLDHVSDVEDDVVQEEEECDVKPSSTGQPPVIVSPSNYDTEYFYNNNNTGDYKMDYTVLYKESSTSGDGGASYYCPLSDYYPNGGVQYISASAGQELIVHHSPFMFSKGATNNNNTGISTATAANIHSIKQRQSYSLDFKLSAIECYYRDSVCRGNQRAVASKFRIHRRQVQKWLKQEDQLRQRNETIKPIHIVR